MTPSIPPSVRAVLFDVYGTLLDGPAESDRRSKMEAVARRFGLFHESPLDRAWDEAVTAVHRASPERWPEIDAREIWQHLFPEAAGTETLALEMEEAVHPVSPTPWARDLLDQAIRLEGPLGIVSNAQHYTRTLLQRHFPAHWPHFRSDLLVFSYQHRIAKPDLRLFEHALQTLRAEAIANREILMIGDSEIHDGDPARQLGLGFLQVPCATPGDRDPLTTAPPP